MRARLLLLPPAAGRVKVEDSSLSAIVSLVEVRARGRDVGRVRDGGAVVMTGSGPRLGVLLLLAVLLQTVVVTITVLHFSTALNSVRSQCGLGTWRRSARARSSRISDRFLCRTARGARATNRRGAFKASNRPTLTFVSSASRQGGGAHFMMSCNYQAAFRVRACARPGLQLTWTRSSLTRRPCLQELIFKPNQLRRK